MTITYRGAVVRNIKSNSYYGYDIDATNYIRSVESADGQTLETGVKDAINAFVVGCKSDGIWDAIKAACIMAGARTLDGALVPLVGTAPTNNNFVSGDYDRKLGIEGNGATKYLDSNRNNNADPQNDVHMSAYCGSTISTFGRTIIGSETGSTYAIIVPATTTSTFFAANDNAASQTPTVNPGGSFFCGWSRSSSASFNYRFDGTQSTITRSSNGQTNRNTTVFARQTITVGGFFNDRISFYSIGEALDLALLDTRVTSLMAQLAFAINTGLSPVGYSSETIDYVNAGYAAGGSLA